MAYNKAKEEYRWNQWKAEEEKILREQGVDEETIQKLREQDFLDGRWNNKNTGDSLSEKRISGVSVFISISQQFHRSGVQYPPIQDTNR